MERFGVAALEFDSVIDAGNDFEGTHNFRQEVVTKGGHSPQRWGERYLNKVGTYLSVTAVFFSFSFLLRFSLTKFANTKKIKCAKC